MRQKIWIQLFVTIFVIFALFAFLGTYLLPNAGWAFWLFWMSAPLCFSAALVHESNTTPGRDNIALNRRGNYSDLGPGNLPLGLMMLFAKPVIYSPRPRDLRQTVTLPTRDGTVLIGQASITWQPDRRQIGIFLEQEPEVRLPDLLTGHLQKWSKQILPGELYFKNPPVPVIPGIVVTLLTLTDIAQGEGGMNHHIWDNTHLLDSIVNEIKDENRIEIKRAELKRDYPDRAKRIDQLIEQRRAELRRRGLRENR